MGCPTCENRTGPETLLESLCEKHFAEYEGPSSEEMRAAMESGRILVEAIRRSRNGGYRPSR